MRTLLGFGFLGITRKVSIINLPDFGSTIGDVFAFVRTPRLDSYI
jgi:hypothetical protein